MPRGVAQERNPSIQHLTACGQIRCIPGGGENYALVRSSRSGVWGGALQGRVRSLPVVENRKEVVIPSLRVHHEYPYDEDFLYERLLCSKICVVKK